MRVLVAVAVVATLFGALTPAAPAQSDEELYRPPEFSASFGPPEAALGRWVGQTASLRRSPRAEAPVAAEVTTDPYDLDVVVERISGDFAYVRRGRDEGWARLTEAVPTAMGVVLDPKTARVVARFSLGTGEDRVAFSRDGSRAVFYGCDTLGDDANVASE